MLICALPASIHSNPSAEKSIWCSDGSAAIDPVEVSDPLPHSGVPREVRHPPFEFPFVGPFAALRELPAHEQQLLAGVTPHVAVQRSEVGELLPVVARHLPDQRALAVDDLVVRQRQHEVLVECVDQRKRELAVVVLAKHRIELHVLERVVHPAHVPFEAESEAAHARWGGTPWARRSIPRRSSRHPDDRGRPPRSARAGNSIASRFSRPPIAVRNPFALLARVVEVEHRGHRIDPHAVDVIMLRTRTRADDSRKLRTSLRP